MKHKESRPRYLNTSIPYYYPAFLDLTGKKAIVVGGGRVAERKIFGLIKARADVKIISPHLTKRLIKEKSKGTIEHTCRQYRKGDLRNAFIVIAATDSLRINERVSRDAPCLVNIVDMPNLCNFIVPSLIKRGHLQFAISTSGMSPALSSSIRKELEKRYGPEFSDYLKALKKIRREALRSIKDKKKRAEFLKSIASEKIIETLRKKGSKKTKKYINFLLRDAAN